MATEKQKYKKVYLAWSWGNTWCPPDNFPMEWNFLKSHARTLSPDAEKSPKPEGVSAISLIWKKCRINLKTKMHSREKKKWFKSFHSSPSLQTV
jgi:hypothetical protein